MIQRAVEFAVCLSFSCALVYGDELQLDPQAAYSAERSNAVTYDFELLVTVTPPEPVSSVRSP